MQQQKLVTQLRSILGGDAAAADIGIGEHHDDARADLSIDPHTNVLVPRSVPAIWVACINGAVPFAYL